MPVKAANRMGVVDSMRVTNYVRSLLPALLFICYSRCILAQGMGSTHPTRPSTPAAGEIAATSDIWIEDIAANAGLNFEHVSGNPVAKKYLLEVTGSGAAIFDYDGDGLQDIFFVNGRRWSTVAGEPRPTGHLFKNLGGMRFRDVTVEAGLTYEGWGQGVCVGDYDNDGHEDLFVTYSGHNILYHNDGRGHFVDVTAAAGLPTDGSRWGTGCSFFDFDRDGQLDIAVANYVAFDPKTTPLPGGNVVCHFKGLPVVCGPRGLPGGTNVLYHNLGGGRFKDVSKSSYFDRPAGHYCYSAITADYDGDGWPDVFLACDSTPNILQHNKHDGTFEDVAISSGAAFNDNGEEQGSMGADAGDYTHAGHQSVVVTTFDDDVPALFLNDGHGTFDDVYSKAGLGRRTHQVGWGTAFVDLDNSGWPDIFMVNGHVYPNVDSLQRESRYKEGKYLYHNLHNGSFSDITQQSGPGMSALDVSRGLAYGDLENNGSLALVINNLGSRPNLLVNRKEKGNWLTVHLIGKVSNRDAIGARVALVADGERQTAEVRSGCCYLSQSDMRLHFGLGKAARVESLDVFWPSGLEEEFAVPRINVFMGLVEGTGTKLTSTPVVARTSNSR